MACWTAGKPSSIECKYVMKSTYDWDRFMRFMERYRPCSPSGLQTSRLCVCVFYALVQITDADALVLLPRCVGMLRRTASASAARTKQGKRGVLVAVDIFRCCVGPAARRPKSRAAGVLGLMRCLPNQTLILITERC